ncbi:TPA: hypothetical protein PTV68_002467 [Clostridium botulinum]|uniref:hypothetical protein n=1 Tax=Clostridium botulinum TaxID=1491 RepID=UPI0029A3F792|nr:hypothetical protein [Clostridium botulinum]HDK7188727.1 hypothetical protein [Clostridium botulinum]HDK7215646.1 hypothetical protein [Clostridium botulinum]HDK7231400.1 hypothetical protein [Clostridium botulinum]HDK7261150.1 hypothetical protein [Clostridium botulinum]
MNKNEIALGAKLELARCKFFFYCNLKAPNFYKQDKTYLVELCNEFKEFFYSDEEVMI